MGGIPHKLMNSLTEITHLPIGQAILQEYAGHG
jgi:hypothetical protein